MKFTSIFNPVFLFRPRFALTRLWREYHAPYNPLQETELTWGHRIRININDAIGRAVWHQGLYDLLVCEALYRLAEPGSVAIDAGANIG